MQPRERFIAALERRPLTGRVPHFELVFFLTMEAFGRVHPQHRIFHQWGQMEEKERELHRRDVADVYIATAERYEHSAIFLQPFFIDKGLFDPDNEEETARIVDIIREKTGDRFFVMIHGDATFAIPYGGEMMDFSMRIAEDPDGLHAEAQAEVVKALGMAERLSRRTSLDGFALCSDYCLNVGPFLSPALFADFVAPYLSTLIQGYRDLGFYTIKHTDGNIMPILDQIIQTGPHALHSIDPQAGVDIAEVKRRHGGEVCLIGNVNCGLLQTGSEEEVAESVRYALRSGMPGGGYIFSTSNCIYTGMPLSRYELMLDIWRREGNYA